MHSCKSLPYGDQRRLEIVRALATRPKLLLLDEPAAGMNPTEKAELMKLIRFTQEKFGCAVLARRARYESGHGHLPAHQRARLRAENRRGQPAGNPLRSARSSRPIWERRARMLEIKELVVNYGSIAALHGISLRVEQGSIVTLVGANGAGKTTTLRAISGIVRAKSGAILFDGEDITRCPPHADRRARSRAISRGPHGLCQSHSDGKPAHGRLPAQRQGGHGEGS